MLRDIWRAKNENESSL